MKFKPFVALTIISLVAAIIISGCSKVVPIEQMNMQEAGNAYQEGNYDKALELYLNLLEGDLKKEYVITAHYRCGEIYKKQQKWDEAVAHYQAVIDISPTGDLGTKSKGSIADIRKYRQIITQNDYTYRNIRRTEEGKPIEEDYSKGAEALYEMARAYEALKVYDKAIEYYSKLVEEFPKHEKAPQSQFQIGNIYFYKLYNYQKGWPQFVKVIEEYPDSYEADEADRILKETKSTLDNISQYMEHVKKYTSEKALDYEEAGRYVSQAAKYGAFTDQIAQDYINIAKSWIDLKNYPNAIETYKELARELPMEKFTAAEARYQVARLYQEDGQYQRAIEAYNNLFEKSPESSRRNDATYRQAVCYQAVGEFEKAYEGFKTYLGFSEENVDKELFREAKQKVRQMEMDQDNDGYLFYQEAEANTSDQNPNEHP